MGERAVVYREKNGITKDIANGTAVNVVTMVFGNMGDDSATGVVFTRNGHNGCLLYTSPSPRDRTRSRMPSSA